MKSRWMISHYAAAVILFVFASLFASTLLAQAPKAPAAKAATRASGNHPNFAGYWSPAGGSAVNERTGPRTTRKAIVKELPLTPKGRERAEYLIHGDGEFPGETGDASDPRYHSVCGAPISPAALNGPMQIVHDPERLFISYVPGIDSTGEFWVRQAWIGKQLPKDPTDFNLNWMGHSVANWDGDALVVDTIRIQGGTMIEPGKGAPQSDGFTMQERFELVDPQTLRVTRTFKDSTYYTRTWGDAKTYKLTTKWDDVRESWEDIEPHQVCVGGQFPDDNDVFFQPVKK